MTSIERKEQKLEKLFKVDISTWPFRVIRVMGNFETEIESVPVTKERKAPKDIDALNNAGTIYDL